MQADATVAPTCIDIIYVLHVYLSLCAITIYCKCVSTNKILSIVYLLILLLYFSHKFVNSKVLRQYQTLQ